MRKTKIICTMGPSCGTAAVLKEMMLAGMNVARLNMAHGELDDHRSRIRLIRETAAEAGAIVSIMMDIKGPEVRIGTLQDSSYELRAGDRFTLTVEQLAGNQERVSVNYPDLPAVVEIGSRILIDDGLIELHVADIVEGREVVCTVMNGGQLKPRKGVNLPGIHTTLPGVTERDVQHILFGIEEGVDMIAASFVRKAEDVLEIRQILEDRQASHIQIISKIENEEGVDQLDAIVDASDGIMVARGDLGVEIPAEEVPMVQKRMIDRCNSAGKPVIVATQMLDSMQVNPRPTRAEVSDVANAVMQGADVVMLSGETAAGKYPLESVRMMATIAERTESTIDYAEAYRNRAKLASPSITEAISQAVVSSSLQLGASAILTPTESGFTARMVAKYRPQAPIVGIAADAHVLHRLNLLRGVIPVLGARAGSTDERIEAALQQGRLSGLLKDGDYAVVTAGVPQGESGATNLIRIHRMGDEV